MPICMLTNNIAFAQSFLPAEGAGQRAVQGDTHDQYVLS